MSITDKEMTTASVIARQTARKWRLTDFQDIQSELYLWLTVKASKGVLQRYRTEQYGEQKLYTALQRHATSYAIKETETITGQKLMPFNNKGEHYAYTTENITNALPYLWDYTQMQLNNTVENPTTGEALHYAYHENIIEDIMVSIKIALTQLNYSDQLILEFKYRDGKTYKQVGDMLTIKEDAARMRIKRLILKIQKLIG